MSHQYDIQMDQFQVIENSKGKVSYETTSRRASNAGQKKEVNATASQQAQASTDAANRKNSNEVKRESDLAGQEAESNFFLTGVNVHNKDIEQYALEEKPNEESHMGPVRMSQDDFLAQEELVAHKVDKYKMIAVVDTGRSFANNEVSRNQGG